MEPQVFHPPSGLTGYMCRSAYFEKEKNTHVPVFAKRVQAFRIKM